MKKFILAALLCISANGFAQLIQFGPQFSYNILLRLQMISAQKAPELDMALQGLRG
ncbi:MULTISPECIES: hypothetical protein [unclassified Flavobacterium]|jgi:hypothetical protein|uniref:hypothetical protein n=1 Tax=unclassified Flavobacterium TaxID=196869 RepID=UPI0012A9F759|nr:MULTISPECIES: hypothetical protein [unclassified Flavobacterium]MBF4487320.1 hypothetical protein [Flavobacterium sp. CSZ]QGK72711.1 hypothetical protein GIY83_01085 [Flavobacterium sp. SLB02]